MSEKTEREKLIKELNKFGFDDTLNCCVEVNDVVDFILADRKRVVEPIVRFSNQPHTVQDYEARAAKAMVETLKNAGR